MKKCKISPDYTAQGGGGGGGRGREAHRRRLGKEKYRVSVREGGGTAERMEARRGGWVFGEGSGASVLRCRRGQKGQEEILSKKRKRGSRRHRGQSPSGGEGQNQPHLCASTVVSIPGPSPTSAPSGAEEE